MKKLFQSFICQSVFLLSFLLLYSSCQFDIKNDTTLPSDIYNLKVQAEDSCIIFNWENPSDSEFNKIEISITPSVQGVSQILLNEKTNTYQWQNLNNNIEYTFTLYTINKKNNKSKGVTIKGTPVDKTPPSEVSDISATTSDSFISLSWTDPSDIDFSSVEICFTPSVNNVQQPILVQKKFGKQNSYKISGLNNGIEYKFTLKTLDNNGNKSKGISFWASSEKPVEETPEEIKDDSSEEIKDNPPEEIKDNPPEEIKDETPPADVENLTANIGDSSILLSWTNPSDDDFSHIEITFIPKESNISQPIVKYGTKGRSDNKLIQGLQNETEYTFTVKAVDNSGNKTDGKTVKAKPIDKTPPSKVSNISVLPWDGSISLSWKNPDDSDFSHVEIIVSSEQCDIDETIQKQGNPGKTNSHFFNNLENGIEYIFTITAVDTKGNKSEPILINERPEDLIPPSEVSNYSVTIGDKRLFINYTDPTDNDLDYVDIIIQTKDGTLFHPESCSWLYSTNSLNELIITYLYNGFENNTDYYITLQSVDTSGNKSPGITLVATPIESSIEMNISLPNDSDGKIVLTNDTAPVQFQINSSYPIEKMVWKKGQKGYIPTEFLLDDPSSNQITDDSINIFYVNENGWYDIGVRSTEGGVTEFKQVEVKTIDRTSPKDVENFSSYSEGKYVFINCDCPLPNNEYDSPIEKIRISYNYNRTDENTVIDFPVDLETYSFRISDDKGDEDVIFYCIQTIDKLGNVSRGFNSRVDCCTYYEATPDTLANVIKRMKEDGKVVVSGYWNDNCYSKTHPALWSYAGAQLYVELDLSNVTGLETIKENGFWRWDKITKLILPNTTTTIKDSAFKGCTKLTDIVFPEGLLSIGEEAFDSCSELTNAIFRDETSNWYLSDGTNIGAMSQPIYNAILLKTTYVKKALIKNNE